jgi:hypothetical protein
VCVCVCVCARARARDYEDTHICMCPCVCATWAPILDRFSASTARLRRAKAVFSCTPGLAAWRPIAVTKALIPPCVCVCVCVFAIARAHTFACVNVYALPCRRSCGGQKRKTQPAPSRPTLQSRTTLWPGTPPLVIHHRLPEEYASCACNFNDLRLAS